MRARLWSRSLVAIAPTFVAISTAISARADEPAQEPQRAEQVTAEKRAAEKEVLVRGDAADNLVKASGSGTAISETEIQHAQPQNTTEIFRRVPGLVVRTEDPSGLRLNVGVRGLNPTRSRLVVLEEDGIPVVVSPYGEPELYYSTPVERAQYIEVLKGHDVLLYGPQTVGGVIRVNTRAAPISREWALEADYGSNAFRKVLGRYGDAQGDVRYMIQAFHKSGDGFRGMSFHANDVMTKLTAPTGKWGEGTLKLVLYEEGSATTYVGLTESLYERDARQDTVAPNDTFGVKRVELSYLHEARLGKNTTLRSKVFAYGMRLDFRQEDFDRAPEPGIEYQRVLGLRGISGAALYFRGTSTLRNRLYSVIGVEPQLEHRFATFGIAHKFIIGARAMSDIAKRQASHAPSTTAEQGQLATDDTTSIFGLAAYAEDRIAIAPWLLAIPAIRVENSWSRRDTRRVQDLTTGVRRNVDITGSAHAAGVMPGFGAVAGVTDMNVFAGVHSGYSPPRISQAITPDGIDQALDAERSVNYEFGTRLRPLRWLRVEEALFLTNFDNQLVSNNTLSGSSAEFKNGGETRHLGSETTLLARVGRGLRLRSDVDLAFQYTFARSTFVGGVNNDRFVPYAPQHVGTATVDVEHPTGVGGQVSFSYTGDQFADENNTVEPELSGRAGKVPAYTVLDVGVRYRHNPTGLGARLTVKNLLDDVYLASRLPNGIFTGGFRQVFFGISWTGSNQADTSRD